MHELYQLVDYTSLHVVCVEYQEVNKWICAITSLSEGYTVERYHLYYDETNSLYRVIVFQLLHSIKNHFFVSFEKSKSLFIAQVASNSSIILQNLQGRERRTVVKEYSSEQIKGYLYMTDLEIPAIWNILINWEIRNSFDEKNCLEKCRIDILSNALGSIHLKSSDELYAIQLNSNKINSILPIMKDQTINNEQNGCLRPNNDPISLKLHSKIQICKILEKCLVDLHLRVFTNHSLDEYDSSKQGINIDQNFLNGLSFALNQICPVMMTSINFGIVAFQIIDNQRSSNAYTKEIRLERLTQFFQIFGVGKSSLVHLVCIYMNDDFSNLRVVLCGSKKKEKVEVEFNVDFTKYECVNDFCKKLCSTCYKKDFQHKEIIADLTARLYLLRHCENMIDLYEYNKIKQQTIMNNVILWTSTQHKVISYCSASFNSVESKTPLRLLICGTGGTGKTLILIHISKLFIRLTGENVLICINHEKTLLLESVKKYVSADPVMRKKTIVSNEISSDTIDGIGLLSIDEPKPHHLLLLRKFPSLQKVVMTSKTDLKERYHLFEKDLMKFHCIHLFRYCRALPKITHLINRFYKHFHKNGIIKQREYLEVNDKSSGFVSIKIEDDPSPTRHIYLKLCLDHIHQLLAIETEIVTVVILSHLSFHDLLRQRLEDPTNRVAIVDPNELQGCECRNMVLILDAACCIITYDEMINLLTCVQCSLICLVNKTSIPYRLKNDYCFQTKTVSRLELVQFSRAFEAQSSDFSSHILVNNNNLCDVKLTSAVVCDFSNRFELYRHTNWRVGRNRACLETKDAPYFMDINPTTGRLSRNCHSPYIQLILADTDETPCEVSKIKEIINTFFINEASVN